jgi:hypothetical protein
VTIQSEPDPQKPDPLFGCDFPRRFRVVSLNVKYEDGTDEFLDFPESNLPFYLIKANYLENGEGKITRQFFEHSISWTETHWEKPRG